MSVVAPPQPPVLATGAPLPEADPGPRRRRRPMSAMARQQARSAWLFLAVPIALFVVFLALPIAIAVAASFTDYSIVQPGEWVGLDNFARIVNDEFFWIALRNTAYYTALYVPLGLVVALGAALLINQNRRVSRVFRTLFYIPVISSTVATAAIWFWLLNPQYGAINALLATVGIDGPAWLYDSQWAMPAIVIMSVWAGFGVNMIIFLAGLQGVPNELVEAARLDGAGSVRVFRHVTVPALSRTFFLVATLLIIGAFQVFDQAYVLTKGGPGNSTVTLVYYIYDRGFGRLEMGYASAISLVLFAIILVFSLFNARLSNPKGDRR